MRSNLVCIFISNLHKHNDFKNNKISKLERKTSFIVDKSAINRSRILN